MCNSFAKAARDLVTEVFKKENGAPSAAHFSGFFKALEARIAEELESRNDNRTEDERLSGVSSMARGPVCPMPGCEADETGEGYASCLDDVAQDDNEGEVK